MKTPEEIKRGLECCVVDVDRVARCGDCPYAAECGVGVVELESDALAYIEQLEAEREGLLQKLQQPYNAGQPTRWISAEMPPEDDERYIVFDGNQIEVADYWGNGKWANHRFGVMICDVTHYMPLPKVPKEE